MELISTVANFLRTAINARLKAQEAAAGKDAQEQIAEQATGRRKGISIPAFTKLLMSKMKMLNIEPAFAGR